MLALSLRETLVNDRCRPLRREPVSRLPSVGWLLVIGEVEALRWIIANGRTGFRSNTRSGGIAAGDSFALYTTRGSYHNPNTCVSQVLGLGTFTSSVNDEDVVIAREHFPKSVPLAFASLLPERKGMPFVPLVPKLSFIRSKTGWAPYLHSALVQVPDSDMRLIVREFNRHAASADR